MQKKKGRIVQYIQNSVRICIVFCSFVCGFGETDKTRGRNTQHILFYAQVCGNNLLLSLHIFLVNCFFWLSCIHADGTHIEYTGKNEVYIGRGAARQNRLSFQSFQSSHTDLDCTSLITFSLKSNIKFKQYWKKMTPKKKIFISFFLHTVSSFFLDVSNWTFLGH